MPHLVFFYSSLMPPVTYSGLLGERYTGLGAQTGAQKKLFKFSFSVVFQYIKYVEIAINDFTGYLIISKWLRKPKCRKKRKKVEEKVEPKEQAVYESVSIPLNTNRSRKCSPFLRSKLFTNTSSCDSFYATCCIFSDRFADLATL